MTVESQKVDTKLMCEASFLHIIILLYAKAIYFIASFNNMCMTRIPVLFYYIVNIDGTTASLL